MKYKTMQEIEARKAQILEEMDKEGADLAALKAEVEELRKNAEEIKKAAEDAKETRRMIAEGLAGTATETHVENKAKSLDEIRGSQEYMDAFAKYIISGDDKECRSVLTENAQSGGQVPVPVLIDGIIRTAWEKENILSRVRKTNFKGNLRAPFELSADPAAIHEEGAAAPTEEEVTLGIVTMIPKMIKKWITISDEVLAMDSVAMLTYIYNELTHNVLKLLSSLVIADITGAGTTNTATAIGIPAISGAPSLTVIPEAEAQLTDEAENVVVVINRKTSADFEAARVAGNFAVDPYRGLTVVYSDALPAYADASSGDVYMIVGDLYAAQVNYPEGEGVITKYDDMSLAEKDLVKIVGRQYAAHAVTGPGRLVNVKKA